MGRCGQAVLAGVRGQECCAVLCQAKLAGGPLEIEMVLEPRYPCALVCAPAAKRGRRID